jgi:hypothetical protein
VTISGLEQFILGSSSGNSNTGDGIVTDIAATATSPTKIASSLTLIDASATTGGVDIVAGATNTSGAGPFDNGASLDAIRRTSWRQWRAGNHPAPRPAVTRRRQ